MTVVEKPDGYEFREKRADKENKASLWTAQDAIYNTAERIKDEDVTQLVVYWWSRNAEGNEILALDECNDMPRRARIATAEGAQRPDGAERLTGRALLRLSGTGYQPALSFVQTWTLAGCLQLIRLRNP